MDTSSQHQLAQTDDQLELIDRLLDTLRSELSSDIERVLPEEYRAGIRAKLTERIASLRATRPTTHRSPRPFD